MVVLAVLSVAVTTCKILPPVPLANLALVTAPSINCAVPTEPLAGLTSLHVHEANRLDHNASVGLAIELKDTIERIGSDKKINSKKVKK